MTEIKLAKHIVVGFPKQRNSGEVEWQLREAFAKGDILAEHKSIAAELKRIVFSMHASFNEMNENKFITSVEDLSKLARELRCAE